MHVSELVFGFVLGCYASAGKLAIVLCLLLILSRFDVVEEVGDL